MNNKNSVGYLAGKIIGTVLAACFTGIVGTFCIGITIKLLSWFINWMF